MLILLSLLISLFRFIPNQEAKKAAEAKAAKAAKEAEAAAIAAAEGTTTDGFVVRSIRKVKRNRR